MSFSPTKQKSIIIIDDHPLFRDGLKFILKGDPRYIVIGEAGTAAEGLLMVREYQPDLATVDISLPDRNGLVLTREIRTMSEKTQVMVISMYADEQSIAEAFQAGARGYVAKGSPENHTLHGFEAVLNGEYFLDTSVTQGVVDALLDNPIKEIRPNDQAYSRLTVREQEILRLLVEGSEPEEIADILHISHRTVENHRTNLMQKLEFRSTFELIRYAVKIGLIDTDIWKT